MVKSYIMNDIRAVLRGVEQVVAAMSHTQQAHYQQLWKNSNIRMLLEENSNNLAQCVKSVNNQDFSHSIREAVERSAAVVEGVRSYTKYPNKPTSASQVPPPTTTPEGVSPDDLKVLELNYKDKQLIKKLEQEHEIKLQKEQELKNKELTKQLEQQNKVKLQEEQELKKKKQGKRQISSVESKKIDNVQTKPATETSKRIETVSVAPGTSTRKERDGATPGPSTRKFEPIRQQLNPEAKQRSVPSTRIGRMVSFGSLAAGLGLGTVAEATRRTLGIGEGTKVGEPFTLDKLFLTEANAERIVSTLCKVRGAALKIGQILSIQDNSVISPGLQKAFERVRQSADFMPTWQVYKVLSSELGPDWRDKLEDFEERPFAAASIGQVHLVRLRDGREAAMKIQYPGVARGIDSDINNLVGILKVWNVFPEGLFIDNLVYVAKRELSWEVDYKREADCTKKFKALLAPYSDYQVPDVIDDLSTGQIFTSSLIEGIPVDKCVDLEVQHREQLAMLLMQLCLRELFEFHYMQTDPNWSNFFYNPATRKLALLDFGASRSYDKVFLDQYIRVIKAAADGDRGKVLDISRQMKFLTGYESQAMENAHVSAVMILAEVFSSEKAFDFGGQDTTQRIQKLVPTIIAERLCPPPEEIYSLHRKLSGVFLLCAKLRVHISCREMFLQVYNKYKTQR